MEKEEYKLITNILHFPQFIYPSGYEIHSNGHIESAVCKPQDPDQSRVLSSANESAKRHISWTTLGRKSEKQIPDNTWSSSDRKACILICQFPTKTLFNTLERFCVHLTLCTDYFLFYINIRLLGRDNLGNIIGKFKLDTLSRLCFCKYISFEEPNTVDLSILISLLMSSILSSNLYLALFISCFFFFFFQNLRHNIVFCFQNHWFNLLGLGGILWIAKISSFYISTPGRFGMDSTPWLVLQYFVQTDGQTDTQTESCRT